jgi:hypothetical protein
LVTPSRFDKPIWSAVAGERPTIRPFTDGAGLQW